jgi:hypothetical protein
MVEQKAEEAEKGAKKNDANNPPVPPIVGIDQEPHTAGPKGRQQNNAGDLAQQIRHTDHIIAASAAITALLTLVLAIFTGLQAYSFIESERAFLVVRDIHFKHGNPTLDADGYDIVMLIENSGKHVAKVTKINLTNGFFIKKKGLPDVPPNGALLSKIVPPIVPGQDLTVYLHAELPVNLEISAVERLAGVLDGTIPLRTFGFIEYDRGYPWPWPGKIGFCQDYVPMTRRENVSFETCDKGAYTYTE